MVRPTPSRTGSRLFHNGVRLSRNRAAERAKRQGVGAGALRVRPGQDNFVKLRGSVAARKVARSVRTTYTRGGTNFSSRMSGTEEKKFLNWIPETR
jgi:hypothetical protein